MRFVTIEELTTASKAPTHNSTLVVSEPARGSKALADPAGSASSVVSAPSPNLNSPDLSDKSKAVELKFKKASESDEQRIVYGVVYTPGYLDTDWETISAEDVQKMAWNFLAQRSADSIDIQHNLEKSGCEVVESFIARAGDPDFPESSWVLGVRCTPETWKRVKKGELNGFSLYGQVAKYPAKVMLEVAKQISGTTEESTVNILPFHEHSFMLNLNSKGQIVSGRTDTKLGHFHKITMGTATEMSLDHNHRYFSE